MKLQALYKAILESLNAVSDKEGFVSLQNGEDSYPCMVDGKRLAIPTRELLRQGNWDQNGLQPFHPMSEHMSRGESPVLKKLRLLIQVRLATVYENVILILADVCSDAKKHKTLAPKAAAVLQVMPDADEKTYDSLVKILDAAMKDVGNVVRVYLRRGVMFNGVKVPRACTVRFPLLEEFSNDDNLTVYGVKLRKKDFKQIKALLEYITPDADEIETYGSGSMSSVAPYFDSLVRAYSNAARQLNSLVWLYRKHTDSEKELTTDLDWVDELDNLDNYRNDIPSLTGNEGELLTEESAGIQRGAAVTGDVEPRRTARRNVVESVANTSHVTSNAAGIATGYNAGIPTGAQLSTDMKEEVKAKADDADDVPSTSSFNVAAASEALRRPTIPQLQAPVFGGGNGGGNSFAEMQAARQRSFQNSIPMPQYNAPPTMGPAVAPGRFASHISTPYQRGMMGNGSSQYGVAPQYQPQAFGQNFGPTPGYGQQQI